MGRDLISPFYSPCIGGLCVPGRQGRLHHQLVPPLAGAADPDLPAGLSRSRVTTTDAATTARSGGRHRPAPSPTRTASTRGETRFPLVMQNLHRYFFYAGLVFNTLLTIDAVEAFREPGHRLGRERRHDRAVRERRPAVDVLAQLPRLSPPRRRPREELQGRTPFDIDSGRS